MKDFKVAWKHRSDPEAAGFRYFTTPALNADSARMVFHTWAADLGISQGETRIIYVSLA